MEDNSHLQDYEIHRQLLKEHCKHHETKNKHTFIFQFFENRIFLQEIFNNYIQKIGKCESDCDFVIIILIRLLYLLGSDKPSFVKSEESRIEEVSKQELMDRICNCLAQFPFWPPKYNTDSAAHQSNLNDLVFWSENHLFMTLGSAYLLYQFQAERSQRGDEWHQEIECRLLEKYLDVHCDPLFPGGTYEVNSHVYLPYSLSALLNLYDFAKDDSVRLRAEKIIDRISYQLMLGTDPALGIATFTASARAFTRTRLRAFDHNINQLIFLMNRGISPNSYSASALTDFLLTTTWMPKADSFQALHYDGFLKSLPMSHDLTNLPILYGHFFDEGSSEVDEYTPLYWSAGLVTHPTIAAKTRLYQRKKAMTHNKHLWPLSFFFFSDVNFVSNMEQYEHFSKGQVYTGISLNVYKRPSHGLIFSSFQLYNPHYCGFQQFPWIANLQGVPIWSQSGLGSESIAGFGIMNTHNPAVQQLADIMLITYLAPEALFGLIIRNLFCAKVRFFWPMPLFDYHVVKEYSKLSKEENITLKPSKTFFSSLPFKGREKNPKMKGSAILPSTEEELILKSEKHKVWCIGQKNSLFVAVLCTNGVSIDYKDTSDARFTSRIDMESSITVTIPRLVCEAKYHSWVVVVGTTSEYPDIDAFIDQRLSRITVNEVIRGNDVYDVVVIDQDHQLRYCYDLRKREPKV